MTDCQAKTTRNRGGMMMTLPCRNTAKAARALRDGRTLQVCASHETCAERRLL